MKASNIEVRHAEIELRIVTRLREVGPDACDLPFDDVADFPLNAVDRNEVSVRFNALKRQEWITGEVADTHFRRALLSAAGKARLDAVVPGTKGSTWLQRVRGILAECDAGNRSAEGLLQAREALFGDPLGPESEWLPNSPRA